MKKKAAPQRAAYLAQLSQGAVSASPALAKLYGGAMAAVARKSVVRLDMQTKRRFCKGCFTPIVPTQTAAIRVVDKSKSQTHPILTVQCHCGHIKRYPLNF